jgi:sigma-B regulation protein RsbU (phosphoserine phosphatase)
VTTEPAPASPLLRRGSEAALEAQRLSAVRRLELLDTPPDGAFDRITSLAARFFGVPISIVSVVDSDRIWFKSRHGLAEVEEIERAPGLCASAILQHDAWVVSDAVTDPRTLANPLVAGEFGLRFYAGIPLTTSEGFNFGTLCVIDKEPRAVTEAELGVLHDLAAIVVDELEMRLAARDAVENESRLRRHAEELASALQASLLPPRPPVLPGMELASRYRAGERGLDVGGDFYDVFRLGTNAWGVVVGDVCGRGARAASLTALARWTIRAAAVRNVPPASVLADLNAALLGDADADDDDHFCTAVFARVELDTCGAWVTLASAGHPRPVVLRRAGWIDVRGHVGLPLGMFADPAPRDDRVGLGPGDALVLLTDGITEARDADGELFDAERLHEVLLDCCGLPAEAVADRVLAAATAFSAGGLADDVALVVLRVPDDAMADPRQRITLATGVPAEEISLPGYPLGDVQPGLWRQPPEPPREARIRLAPEPQSVSVLRRLVGRLLASWRLDPLVGGDIDLLASELATNAILHAATPLTVIVRYLGPVIRVEVGDGSSEAPRRRPAGDDDLDGRGLLIVQGLARAWGVLPTRTGKRVWFEVDTAGASLPA